MREITLGGMRFHALVGILEHERHTPQPIEVDLTVRVGVDSSTPVVDYRTLYSVAARALSAHTGLLEDVAERIAAGVLSLDDRIRSTRVAVRKPQVALAGPVAFAQVAVERTNPE
jgi:dihydroneopterin aldolase